MRCSCPWASCNEEFCRFDYSKLEVESLRCTGNLYPHCVYCILQALCGVGSDGHLRFWNANDGTAQLRSCVLYFSICLCFYVNSHVVLSVVSLFFLGALRSRLRRPPPFLECERRHGDLGSARGPPQGGEPDHACHRWAESTSLHGGHRGVHQGMGHFKVSNLWYMCKYAYVYMSIYIYIYI